MMLRRQSSISSCRPGMHGHMNRAKASSILPTSWLCILAQRARSRFNWAAMGQVICCMRLEISKRVKDRVVLLPGDVDLSDARVEAFVLHCPQSMAPLRRGGIICRLDRHKPC